MGLYGYEVSSFIFQFYRLRGTMNNIKLIPLKDSDREQFILDDQFPDGMFRFEKVMKGTDRA